MLDRVFEFETLSVLDDVPAEQALEHLTNEFTNDPPPGITPVNAQVVRIGEPNEDGEVLIGVRMSVEDFVRNDEIINFLKNAPVHCVAFAAFMWGCFVGSCIASIVFFWLFL